LDALFASVDEIDDEKMAELEPEIEVHQKRFYRIKRRNKIVISRLAYSTVKHGHKYYKSLIAAHVPFRKLDDFVKDIFEKYGEYSWKVIAKNRPEIQDWIIDSDLEIFINHYRSLDADRGNKYDVEKLYSS